MEREREREREREEERGRILMLNGNKKTALKKNKLVVKATIVMQYPLYIQHGKGKSKRF